MKRLSVVTFYIHYKIFFIIKVMPSRFYYQNNKGQYIQAPHDYYNSNKDSILKRLKNKYNVLTAEDREKNNKYAKNWYNNLPDDKKNMQRKACKNRYHTMSKEQRQKYKEYQKKYQSECREKIKKGQGNIDKNAVLTP